ncbi:nitroreductase family deazaflavin-dependent oxidoreductase [Streptomyces sp. TRM66268-LWL]|uniref:Nitroreductase family deazaflavin-dependent oxidoreductase n=1 Tax=Streptomyces polyasparticus TaxID=2767826 RepID=A0ABR7SIK2_9ACTN|nr:nitroreductase family deazaflavin-dependent oxidoreductase [Streptomyces polyasparticus]MBC9715069.1 nitroreductase family deazaflavin-dependent oxidoreductase [Streptomyces polyasparticus]
METVRRPAPPTGLRRALFRAPIRLYRMGLGALVPGRLLLLNHIGRVSGQARQVVVEVVEHERSTGAYIVCSGFGPRAQWYRNLRAHPDVTIQVGARRLAVHAEPLDAEEGGAFMAGYAARHPRAARKLAKFMGFRVDGSLADYRAPGRELPFVRLRPRS